MSKYKVFRRYQTKVENRTVKTFYLDSEMDAKPGQFVMVWIPRVGEKPFTITGTHPLTFSISAVGPFTRILNEKEPTIGVRGPYGNGYSLSQGKNLIVAGGYGVSSLAFLAEHLTSSLLTVVVGAKTNDDLLFVERFSNLGIKPYVTTDDGSAGTQGFTTDVVADLLKTETFDMTYACGPELMMKKLTNLMDKAGIPCQMNVERYMKCAVGVCGACAFGEYQVCKDGPVFSGESLKTILEFGTAHRTKSGRVETFEEARR